VLRIDPPGFDEGATLLCETTVGKRRAILDLHAPSDRARLERLLAQAQVVVHGYRSDALERLGLGNARRRELNPALVDASLDAYGWTGPWAHRRGFDSLVQMSAGIAARGLQAGGSERPLPLPAQALDHGTGYLLAAAVCRALARLFSERRGSSLRLSLARTARLLVDLDASGDPSAPEIAGDEVDRWCEPATTRFGEVRRVRCPGGIDGLEPRWAIDAGPLGAHEAAWW
jgi:crotonobetainyl-CoA:carnitine CoA-transferase CaiB-like acyl-CoA transferase